MEMWCACEGDVCVSVCAEKMPAPFVDGSVDGDAHRKTVTVMRVKKALPYKLK